MHLSQQFFKVNMLNKHKILDKLPKNRVDLHLFENIDSTNEECKRIDQNKDFHVVIAEQQTMGKGRLGKNWSSPSSGNVYMSIYSKELPNNIPLSLIVGLICAKTLNSMIKNDSIGLKWPNDMLLDKKKIGGILVEKEIMGKNPSFESNRRLSTALTSLYSANDIVVLFSMMKAIGYSSISRCRYQRF